MDVPRNAFLMPIIELMSIESKRWMAYSLEPDIVMRIVELSLQWTQHPPPEKSIQMFCVLAMICAVLELYSVRSAAILRFEVSITEKQSNEYFALDVGKLQGRFELFNRS
jgi:hypothetical protein